MGGVNKYKNTLGFKSIFGQISFSYIKKEYKHELSKLETQTWFTNQHVAIFNIEVKEEEEGDEEAEEGNSGAFPQTPHLVEGFPHQPHAALALSGICIRKTWEKTRLGWLALNYTSLKFYMQIIRFFIRQVGEVI